MLTAMTRMFVSSALIVMLLLPCIEAYLACTDMWLSGSSWVHFSSPSKLTSWVLRTAIPFVKISPGILAKIGVNGVKPRTNCNMFDFDGLGLRNIC